MFAFLKGTLEEKLKDKILVDVSGIGFEVHMPQGDISTLNEGENYKIFTYTDIKEGSINIFGFVKKETQSVFEKLIKVSGIGSKTALNILSYMSPTEVCVAIANDDIAILSKVPGLGNKSAARIVLELKDKILKDTPDVINMSKKVANKTSTAVNEAKLALKVLGYSSTQIEAALSEIEKDESSDIASMTVEKIIKMALTKIR